MAVNKLVTTSLSNSCANQQRAQFKLLPHHQAVDLSDQFGLLPYMITVMIMAKLSFFDIAIFDANFAGSNVSLP